MNFAFLTRCLGAVPPTPAKTIRCACCGHRVRGRLDTVPLSILCSRCCERATQPYVPAAGRYYTLPESDAEGVCGLKRHELDVLNSVELRKKRGLNEWETVRFYLRGEVRFLRQHKRKAELELKTGVHVTDIDERLQAAVLGDYLTETAYEETTLAQVMARCCVVSRANGIIQRCPNQDPRVVVQFCLDHGAERDAEFEDIRAKAFRVFQLEGHRIMQGFWQNGCRELAQGPLADIVASARLRDRLSQMRAYLTRWFDADIVEDMLEELFGHGSELQNEGSGAKRAWTLERVDRVVSGFAKFDKTRRHRRQQLVTELKRRRLFAPSDWPEAQRYTNGLGTASLEELVAIADVRFRLEKIYDVSPDGETGLYAVSRMLFHLNGAKLDHEIAVIAGISEAMGNEKQSLRRYA